MSARACLLARFFIFGIQAFGQFGQILDVRSRLPLLAPALACTPSQRLVGSLMYRVLTLSPFSRS
jgi:hypothetical protein